PVVVANPPGSRVDATAVKHGRFQHLSSGAGLAVAAVNGDVAWHVRGHIRTSTGLMVLEDSLASGVHRHLGIVDKGAGEVVSTAGDGRKLLNGRPAGRFQPSPFRA